MGDRTRLLVLGLFVSFDIAKGSAAAPSDIHASLTLEKDQYFIGEPIMLIFRARNTGATLVALSESDPYSKCSSYRIVIDPKEPIHEPQTGPPCSSLLQLETISCLIGGISIAPGQEVERRILLNRIQAFTQPGTYTIDAMRHLSDITNRGKQNAPTRQISATFTLSLVAPKSVDELTAAFSPYLGDLKSVSYKRRDEAATAIAALAAPFLESSLLQMLATPDLQRQAVIGLGHVKTENSRNALFDFIQRDDSFTFDQQRALRSLAEIGTPADAARLLTLRKNTSNTALQAKLLAAAARLDPTIVMPIIKPLLQSQSDQDREDAVNALAEIEKSDVLPLLAKKLTDTSLRVRRAAAIALFSLTSKTPSQDGFTWSGEDPADDAHYWSSWLDANPASPIHPLRECAKFADQ